MNKYVCTICGYVYEEALGVSGDGLAPGTLWQDVPEDWVCPLCGASKDLFSLEATSSQTETNDTLSSVTDEPIEALSSGALSALFSNLSKGCEKQYRYEEQGIFDQLANYYGQKIGPSNDGDIASIKDLVDGSLNQDYKDVLQTAQTYKDRGAMRALGWSEKVTRLQSAIITRYMKDGASILADTTVYVCEICGFVFIGDEAPDLCPVCKVPSMKITEIKRG